MQLESKIVSTLGDGTTYSTTAQNRREIVQEILSKQVRSENKPNPTETKLDIIFAAIVIGLTALFISFIFTSVTEFVPRLIDGVAISFFMGLIVTLIAYALMKEED